MTDNTIIWSKDNCSQCEQAKALLKLHDIVYEERKITDDGKWTRELLLEAVPTARTVPQIFIEGRYLGGFNELRQYFQEAI
jgi:glutaredoxin